MTETNDLKVTFTAKELLGRIDTRLESIDSKLDAKADLRVVMDLQQRIDRIEKFADESRARVDKSNNLFARWQQVSVLVLMIAAIASQSLLARL